MPIAIPVLVRWKKAVSMAATKSSERLALIMTSESVKAERRRNGLGRRLGRAGIVAAFSGLGVRSIIVVVESAAGIAEKEFPGVIGAGDAFPAGGEFDLAGVRVTGNGRDYAFEGEPSVADDGVFELRRQGNRGGFGEGVDGAPVEEADAFGFVLKDLGDEGGDAGVVEVVESDLDGDEGGSDAHAHDGGGDHHFDEGEGAAEIGAICFSPFCPGGFFEVGLFICPRHVRRDDGRSGD